MAKLFQQNLALLSINGLHVTAKLEAPLTAGQSYWFEVQQGESIPKLRVLIGQANTPGTKEQLFERIGVEKTKASELLFRHLTAERFPFSKDELRQGAALLLEFNRLNKAGLQTIKQMISEQLPLKPEIFQALQAQLSREPLVEQLARLMTAAQQSKHEQAKLLSTSLQRVLADIRMPESRSLLTTLLAVYAAGEDQDSRAMAAKQLLERLGLITEKATRLQAAEEMRQALLKPDNQPFAQQMRISEAELRSLTSDAQLSGLLRRAAEGRGSDKQILRLFSAKIDGSQFQQRMLSLLAKLGELGSQEQTLLREAISLAGATRLSGHLQKLISLLGYDYEQEIVHVLQGNRPA